MNMRNASDIIDTSVLGEIEKTIKQAIRNNTSNND